MALHLLTPDELSRFENKMASVETELQKLRLLVLNLKDKTGNDTSIQTSAAAVKTGLNDIGTILGVTIAAA